MLLFRSVLKENSTLVNGAYTVVANNTIEKGSVARAFFNNNSFNSNVRIGNNVINCCSTFSRCENFNKAVEIPYGVEDCSSMFENCINLNQKITIPNSVTNCSRMFANCGNFNADIVVEGAVNCASMFWQCTNFNGNVILGDNVVNCKTMLAFANFNKNLIIPSSVMDCESLMSRYSNQNFGGHLFFKGNKYRRLNVSMVIDTDNQVRRYLHFHSSMNSIFNATNYLYSVVGDDITWTTMTNGFYNTKFNVHCYYNYSG